MGAMEGDTRRDIYVSHAVTIGHAKSVLTDQILRHALETTACTGAVTGVHQSYAPWCGDALVYLHSIVLHVKSHVGHVEKIICEIFFNDISLVSATDNEIVDSVCGICL